ncbi:hypothetical protein DTO96_102512 [Ephemeroptericola cinctiostellae]|uniref:Lipoprotein n=1 Tax=Ephemeroptericola cinctiostellae TaxID=2268024 RepID=A0A345DEG8_9BURK|nr:hypothetical protein [Ephemeroptericola cinctiostellae]AXF86756.1 hypothetical protein DTO96_102512 [Ephemeroptericola cinctiostellae]
MSLINKKGLILLGGLLLYACGDKGAPPPPAQTAEKAKDAKEYVQLKVDKLDVKNLTKNLPIYAETHDKSGVGLPRTRWKIKGASEYSGLEYIGSQNDGAQISLSCQVFDSKGMPTPWIKGQVCYQVAVALVNNVVEGDGTFKSEVMMAKAGLDQAKGLIPDPSVWGKSTDIGISFSGEGYVFVTNYAKKH